jgi:ATP-dependent RNA helicase RhlB
MGDTEAPQAQGTGQVNGRPPHADKREGGKRDAEQRGAGRHSPAPAPHGEAGGSLLSRLGRGLRSLVTRAPRSQH